jgi:hypothetical protein
VPTDAPKAKGISPLEFNEAIAAAFRAMPTNAPLSAALTVAVPKTCYTSLQNNIEELRPN